MAQTRHPDRPPDVARLLAALNDHGIRYVLVGSVAAQVYGAKVQPGDLDITPAPDRENLVRLCELLQALEATLPDTDDVGHRQVKPDGEKSGSRARRRPRIGWRGPAGSLTRTTSRPWIT